MVLVLPAIRCRWICSCEHSFLTYWHDRSQLQICLCLLAESTASHLIADLTNR